MTIIQFKDVWEMYRLKFIIDAKVSWDNFWVLRNIDFKLEKGETLGIIGENGAGKTTILKLMMGAIQPDRGEVIVSGRVSGLLELGAGFKTDLTGRENIYLNSGLFGLSQSQIENKYKEIIDFAAIGKFINAPVKCYSQGMFMRLAFSIAIHVDPDILLIDDTLSVGDEYFQAKCVKKIFELKERGVGIVFVTHDMNMLGRVCKRAIFLKDGRIIKDDLVNKVIPLYSQTVGFSEGVGILENKELKLVFNNGKFLFNWRDKLITPQPGAYVSLFISGKWYNSLQALWQVQRQEENLLVVKAAFYQLGMSLMMRMELKNDFEGAWDIEIESQDCLDIQEVCVNILVSGEYTEWFTSLESGSFPSIGANHKNWLPLLEDDPARICLGVKENNAPGQELPALIFQQSDGSAPYRAQVYNTDYVVNCRALQFRAAGLQNYSSSRAGTFICFSGKIIFNPPDLDNYVRSLEEGRILSNDKIKLIFDHGRIIFSYGGIEISKANHFFSFLYTRKKKYLSYMAHWEIVKIGKSKLIVKGSWAGLPLIQIWELEIDDGGSFSWKIGLEVKEKVEIDDQGIQLDCSSDYDEWFSDYGAGKFPEVFKETIEDMLQRCIPEGQVSLFGRDKQLPDILLEYSRPLNNFAKIYNSDFYDKARILQIQKVEPEQEAFFLEGKYSFLNAKVILRENKQLSVKENNNLIQRNGLKMIFENGKGSIYYKEVEITKRLGLYTSLRSRGRWFDSVSQAAWRIEENNGELIRATGKWLNLPIKQQWVISLKEDGVIEFKVQLLVTQAIEVDRLQANLMLSENYSHWISEGIESAFPFFKDNIDDDWEYLYRGKEAQKDVGVAMNPVADHSLPRVKLFIPTQAAGWFLSIVNSDIYHRGRVLQYLNSQQSKLISGEYPYFAGKIFIES